LVKKSNCEAQILESKDLLTQTPSFLCNKKTEREHKVETRDPGAPGVSNGQDTSRGWDAN
jgi:hypothetical protein